MWKHPFHLLNLSLSGESLKFYRKLEWSKRKSYWFRGKKKVYAYLVKPRITLRKSELLKLNVTPEYPFVYCVDVLPETKQLIITFKQEEIKPKSLLKSPKSD
jgi:hypothetical protein